MECRIFMILFHCLLSGTVIGFSLPSSVIPISYDLEIWTYLQNFTFSGRVIIEIQCLTPTSEVHLHSVDLNIEQSLITPGKNTEKQLKIKQLEELDSFIVIQLNQNLVSNQTYTLSLRFSGELTDNLVGFYRSSYVDAGSVENWVATTRFKPIFARRAFPCFDEPALRATFKIRLGHHRKYQVLGNTAIENITNLSPSWRLTQFKETDRISTYLISFVVFDFKFQNCSSTNGVDVRVWVNPTKIKQANFSCGTISKVFDFYTKHFRFGSLPTELNLIAIPDLYQLELEAPGLMKIREDVLLADLSIFDNSRQIIKVVSRNLARLWFGVKLYLPWWNNAWLLEGIVHYLSRQYEAFHNGISMEMLMLDRRFYFFDSFTSHPVSLSCNSEKEIFQSFDSFTIEKSTFFIHLLWQEFESKIIDVLHDFLESPTVGNLDAKLWLIFEVHKLSTMFNSVENLAKVWMKQSGFAAVTIDHSQSKSLIVTQNRFLLLGKVPYTCWNIVGKFSILLGTKAPVKIVLLPCHKLSLGPDDFFINSTLILHPFTFGFYKVKYDKTTREKVFKYMKKNDQVLDFVVVGNFVEHTLSFASINEIDFNFAIKTLKAMSRLKNSTELILYSVLPHFSHWLSLLRGSPDFFLVQNFIESIFAPIYNSFMKSDKYMQYPHIDATFIQFANHFLKDVQTMDTNHLMLRNNRSNPEGTQCSFIVRGGKDEWTFLLNRYLLSKVEAEKNMILLSLTCSKNENRLIDFLKLTILDYKTIPSYFHTDILLKIIENIGWTRKLSEFFYKNFPMIFFKWDLKENPGYLNAIVLGIARQISTSNDLKEWIDFTTKNSRYLTRVYDLEMAREIIDYNINWIDNIFPLLRMTLSRKSATRRVNYEVNEIKSRCFESKSSVFKIIFLFVVPWLFL